MATDVYMPMSLMDEHFPSLEERARSSTRAMSRSGRVSPAHSAHASMLRSSLMSKQVEKKAKKVRFYRNGDNFFKGLIYAVSPERFRTFEALLCELTESPLCDKNVLPKGVRCIFSLDGSRKITSIDQLDEEESYVCASTALFKSLDYTHSSSPNWTVNVRPEFNDSSNVHFDTPDDNKDFIVPKLITVVASGTKPRKAVRILLNKKTAHSFDQVLSDITASIQLPSGAVRRIFTMDGRQLFNLSDFFHEESVFIAYSSGKSYADDFSLGDNGRVYFGDSAASQLLYLNLEVRFSSAYKSVRRKERITLKSPKLTRRFTPSRNTSNSPPHQNGHSSPGNNRKSSPTMNGSPKRMNGVHNTEPILPHILLTKYKVGKFIGKGNFATVKECFHKQSKQTYALKVINKEKCRGKEHMIENEVNILRRIKHENIIQLIEDFDVDSEFYLVMELVQGGDLFDAISSATKYTERDASGMIYNLMSAVEYLHSLAIVHRDIKPENILLCDHEDGSRSLKLGDFGLATEVHDMLYVVCGSPTYVAPEMLSESGYGVKIDIWASGVIAYILLCGFSPFSSPTNDENELFDQIMSGKFEFRSPFWDDISDSAKDLISCMLQKAPEERFSAADVLEHPWVADDTAKDDDMQSVVVSRLDQTFERSEKLKNEPGVTLITATALDKESRFFKGRKNNQTQNLQALDNSINGDESSF